MATHSSMAMFVTSLLVLLALIWGPAASTALDSANGNYEAFNATDGSRVGFSRGVAPRAEYECPAVCSACPACPSHPGCPACPAAPPCPRRIPPGYLYYDGLGYYKMHYGFRKWHDAELMCAAEGGYLIVINSQNEANLISRLLKQKNLTGLVHIGVNNVNKNGQYLTVLGQDLATAGYSVWAPGQPTNINKEFCVGLAIDKGMHDIWCTDEYPYVCELDQ